MPNQDIIEFLEKKLKLNTVSDELRVEFWNKIVTYLDHGRQDGIINGRTLEFIERKINNLNSFFDMIHLTYEERVQVLTNMPTLLNTSDDLFNKYLLLGAIEKEGSHIRREKLVNKTNDYRVGLDVIYKRYVIACNAGYSNISWNLLVHASHKEFASVFIKSEYNKPYQIFNNIMELEQYMNSISLDTLNFEDVKCWDSNKEIMEEYEKGLR